MIGKRIIGLVGALLAFVTIGVGAAVTASADSVTREPATGSFDCAGYHIPVAFYHSTRVYNGATQHRVYAWYVGNAVTNPSTPNDHKHITKIVFREQSDTVSLGGTDNDYSPGYVLGAQYDALTLTQAPWHTGATYAAFRIWWYSAPYTYNVGCTWKE